MAECLKLSEKHRFGDAKIVPRLSDWPTSLVVFFTSPFSFSDSFSFQDLAKGGLLGTEVSSAPRNSHGSIMAPLSCPNHIHSTTPKERYLMVFGNSRCWDQSLPMIFTHDIHPWRLRRISSLRLCSLKSTCHWQIPGGPRSKVWIQNFKCQYRIFYCKHSQMLHVSNIYLHLGDF